MKLLVRVSREEGSVRVTCVDREWSAVGDSEEAALEALRARAVDYYTRGRAVAPPETCPVVTIELEVTERS